MTAAQQAVDEYVAPPVEVVKHAGCAGIANAQQQVAKNAKGNAPAALATVAAKLGC